MQDRLQRTKAGRGRAPSINCTHRGGEDTITVRLRSTAQGAGTARAWVVATESDPDLSNDAAEQTTTVVPDQASDFVANAGFETGIGGWSTADSGTLLDRAGTAHSGSFAARVRRSRSTGEAQLNDHPNWQARTTAGQTCTAGAWVKGPRGLDVRIRLREYHEGDRVGYNSDGVILPDTNWHKITVMLHVTRAGDSMDLNVYGKNLAVGRELLIDDVSEVCR